MNVPPGSEFRAAALPASDPRVDWRSRITSQPRLDVNRPLPAYPEPSPSTGCINLEDPVTLRRFQAAQVARQGLARDLFLALVTATAAQDPRQTSTPPLTPDPALRWLAQLAVNMVDFLDGDDIMTPFNWGGDPLIWSALPHPPYPGEWVIGTELPRVLINEAFVEHVGSTEHVWVELHNPFHADATLTDDVLSTRGAARLQMPGGHTVYQLIVARGIDPASGQPSSVLATVSQFEPPEGAAVDSRVILPCNGDFAGPNGGNRGFYLLGPAQSDGTAVAFPGLEPPKLPVATLASPALRLPVVHAVQATLILQRLACPHFPENDPARPGYDPGLPYNPFVTVDYVEKVSPEFTALGSHSVGRIQPYAGGNSPVLRRQQQPLTFPDGAPYAAQPQHTFFQHNAREITTAAPSAARVPDPTLPGQTLRMPFDWPVHLDGPVSSPLELLNVSACRPHEFTHRFVSEFSTHLETAVPGAGTVTVGAATSGFYHGYPWSIRPGMQLDVDTGANRETVHVTAVTPTGFTATFTQAHQAHCLIAGPQPFTHLAPWFNQTSRLYRVFEFLQTCSLAAGLEAPSTTAVGPGFGSTSGRNRWRLS